MTSQPSPWDRPRVVTCNTISVDGRLTLAPGVQLIAGDERWRWIAGDSDPYGWVREVHAPDALLEGSGSFVAREAPPVAYPSGAPTSTPLHGHHLPTGVVGAPERRWMTVVDGRGRVQVRFTEWPDPAWAGWHVLVLTSRAVAPAHLGWLRDHGVPYLVAGERRVELGLALRLLADELGVATVVCTGGGLLTGALLRQDLVDEVDLEVLPAAIGGSGTPALFDGAPLDQGRRPTRLELLSHEVTADGHLRLRYAVVRTPARGHPSAGPTSLAVAGQPGEPHPKTDAAGADGACPQEERAMANLSPEIVELQPQEAIAVHGELPMAELTGFFDRAFGAAAAAAGAAGVAIVGPPFGYYPEMPTDTVTVEAGFPVAAPAETQGEARRIVLPGGRAVQVTHVGPYDTLAGTYDRLQAWLVEQGLQPAAGMWESYLSDPEAEPDPATWRTLIVWPLA